MKTVKLTLVRSLIIESVKNDTFRKGLFDKAVDQKATTAAYQEQAGDDTFHERTLDRGLYTAVEELKSHLSDYLNTSGYSTADNSIDSTVENGNIIISLDVSERFNDGYTQSLARLCSKFIEETMLIDWWKPINEKQTALYETYAQKDLAAIKRCFNKTAPVVPSVPYTEKLDVTGSSFCLGVGEEATVTYTLTDGAIDDIECEVEDTTLVTVGRSQQGFTVTGQRRGHTYIRLYSRHNETLYRIVHIYVTNQS